MSKILRLCERLREPDRERQDHGPTRAEPAYLRALLDAVVDMDRWVEVELLKTLGDVNLEQGQLDKDAAKFTRAMRLYVAAVVRCRDPGVGLTLEHRHDYAEKQLAKLRLKQPQCTEGTVEGTGTSSPARLAGKFETLDKRLTAGDDIDSVMVGYARLMVEGIIADDRMLEAEAMKSIADVYLKRGSGTETRDMPCQTKASALNDTVQARWEGVVYLDRGSGTETRDQGGIKAPCRDTTCLTKASALYNTALARWEGVQGSAALLHRLLYTAKIRADVNRAKRIHRKEDRMKKQNFQLPRDIMTSHRDDDVTTYEQARSPTPSNPPRTASEAEVTDHMLYSGYLTIADHVLRNGCLDFAEEVLAFALRLVHDPSKPDRSDEAACLCRLGDVYIKRGQLTNEGKRLTQAAALYNAAMARTDDVINRQTLKEKIQITEQIFLRHVIGKDCNSTPHDTAEKHKQQLKVIRASAKSELERIDEKHNPYQYNDDDPVVREVEVRRAEAVRELFQYISKERQEFVQGLLKECMEKLGPPPCKYAYIGLGSQATELVTPYSDLEFAILIEDGQDNEVTRRYFLHLTDYLHLKVINLGETILPAMAIPSLNDFYSEDPERDWFFDSVTPRGFAFDGFMPWACKTPFGREQTKSKPALSLIQTPAKMAEFQRQDVSLAEGYHLSDVLRRVVLLTGDQTLVDEYRDKVNQTIALSPHPDSFTTTVLMDSIRGFNTEFGTQVPGSELLDVKKEIYRFPSLAIEALRLICGSRVASAWKVIGELEQTQNISKENANHLKVLTSISAELRLRTYLANGGQKERLSPLAETESRGQKHDIPEDEIKSVFYIPDFKMLLRYYHTAIPLKKCILKAIENNSQVQITQFLKTGTMGSSYLYNGIIASNFCQYTASVRYLEEGIKKAGNDKYQRAKILQQLGDTWFRRGSFKKAMDYYQRSMKDREDFYGNDMAHPNIAKSLNKIGKCYSALGNIEEAKVYFERSFGMCPFFPAAHPNIAFSLNSVGIKLTTLDDRKKAISFYEQSLRTRKAVYGEDKPHADIAHTLTHIGWCWSGLGDDRQAIKYFEQALTMMKTVYGDNTAHPSIAELLDTIGESWSKLGYYIRAIGYLEQSLIMTKEIFREDMAHPDIASALASLGVCWSRFGDDKKAISYHEQSLKMRKEIYGHGKAHPKISDSLHNLGLGWSALGEQKKAIRYIEESLEMNKAVHGDDKAYSAAALSNLGQCWTRIGDHGKAISYFEQALTTMTVLHGENASHPDIATFLHNIGHSLSNLGDHKKAINYAEQALDMAKDIYGANTPHLLVAQIHASLGISWGKLGDEVKELSFHETSLKMKKAIFGETTANPEIVHSLKYLGFSCSKLGDQRKAISYFEQALGMGKVIYGDQTATHPDNVELVHNLGTCWSKSGDERKAVSFFEESIAMRKTIYGETTAHSDVAQALDTLGTSWSALGDERKAISSFYESLRMKKSIYGKDTAHPDIVKTLENLGACWSKLDEYRKAIGCFEQVLNMRKTIHGNTTAHSDIAQSHDNLGICWRKLGEESKAISHFEQSLAMRKVIHGEDVTHPDIVQSLDLLGKSWTNLGDERKAIGYFEQSLIMKKAIHGKDTAHPELAETLNNLGTCWSRCGDDRKAIDYHERSLEMNRAIFGNNTAHSDIATTMKNLGISWLALGDVKKAVRYYEQSLLMKQEIYGDETSNSDIAKSLNDLGSCWSLFGDGRKGRRYIEKALKMRKEIYGANAAHPEIATSLKNLGVCWADTLGYHRKAIKYFEQALDMQREMHGDSSKNLRIATTLYNIGSSWSSLGDHRKGIRYYEQSLEMKKEIFGENAAHPTIAMALHRLGSCWGELGDRKKAKSYHEQSQSMQNDILRRQHGNFRT